MISFVACGVHFYYTLGGKELQVQVKDQMPHPQTFCSSCFCEVEKEEALKRHHR